MYHVYHKMQLFVKLTRWGLSQGQNGEAEREIGPAICRFDMHVTIVQAMWLCVCGIWSHESQKHDEHSEENFMNYDIAMIIY